MNRSLAVGWLVASVTGCTLDANVARDPRRDGDVTVTDVTNDAPIDGGLDSPLDAASCGELPWCPEDLNSTGGAENVTLLYPLAVAQLYGTTTNIFADGGIEYVPSVVEFDGTWMGVQQLPVPVQNQCLARFQTTPPSNPCVADAVISFAWPGHADPLQVLVGLPVSELMTIPASTPVHVRLTGSQSTQFLLEVSRQDGVPLVVTGAFNSWCTSCYQHVYPQFAWDLGALHLRRDDGHYCVGRPQFPCTRIFVADALRVEFGASVVRLAPGETVIVPTAIGRYRVTHRAIVRRTTENVPCIGPDHAECADLRPDSYSFEVVRIGDG